jgi:hypothetical protein
MHQLGTDHGVGAGSDRKQQWRHHQRNRQPTDVPAYPFCACHLVRDVFIWLFWRCCMPDRKIWKIWKIWKIQQFYQQVVKPDTVSVSSASHRLSPGGERGLATEGRHHGGVHPPDLGTPSLTPSCTAQGLQSVCVSDYFLP